MGIFISHKSVQFWSEFICTKRAFGARVAQWEGQQFDPRSVCQSNVTEQDTDLHIAHQYARVCVTVENCLVVK